VAFADTTACSAWAGSLSNGSFESVPDSSTGQGLLPNNWLDAGNIEPGADTYSNDGSYGLAPSDFGQFTGVVAADGIRWVAGADFADGFHEAFSQLLGATLTPGASYIFSAAIHQSFGFDPGPGGYEVLLSPSAAFNDVGAVSLGTLAPTAGEDTWLSRSLTFTAPANASALPYFVLSPLAATDVSAYIGIDNVSLDANPNAAVPEPGTFTIFAIASGLMAVIRFRRSKKVIRH